MKNSKSKIDIEVEVDTVEEKKQSVKNRISGLVDVNKMGSDADEIIGAEASGKTGNIFSQKKALVPVAMLAVIILLICVVAGMSPKKPHYDSYCRGNVTIEYVISDYSSLDAVDLYIDGENCKTLEPGDKYKSQEMIGVGTHEIMVKRGGFFGTKATQSFAINEDSYVDCSIDVGEDAIIVSDVKVETEEERAERIEREELAKKTFNLGVSVYFNENLFLNKYDVDIYLDDERLGTIAQGETYTGVLELSGGEHALRFEKICTSDDEESASGSRTFKLDADKCLSCDITSHYGEIDIDEVKDETFEEYSDRIAKEKAEAEAAAAEEEAKKAEEEAKRAEEKAKKEAAEKEQAKSIKEKCKKHSYSMSKLVKDLDENPANAKDKYYGKYVQIEGRVGNIDSDAKYFNLEDPNNEWEFRTMTCTATTDKQKAKIKKLKKGQIIKVGGRVDIVGEILGYGMNIEYITTK